MATLLAHIQTFPGTESSFEQVMASMYEITHRTEPDCLRYEYWRGQQPGFYYCLLSYRDNYAFWQHQASDHHEGQMANFAACIKDLKLEVVDPVATAAPLPAASKQQLPDSASAAEQQQAEIFPIVLADWWLQQCAARK